MRPRSCGDDYRGSFHAGPLSGGPVVKDAGSNPAVPHRPLAASPRYGPGRRPASGLWVWATAAPARPHGHSGGRVEEHLCGPAPRIGQDVELGGETALVRPISRRRGRRASSQLSGEPSGRSRPASGCSRPVPRRPAPRAFARTALATQAMPSLVRAEGRGRIAPSQAVAIDVDDAARHPSVIHARSAVGAGQGRAQTVHLCHSEPKQVAHERPLRCSVTLCMAAGWERFPWLPIVD